MSFLLICVPPFKICTSAWSIFRAVKYPTCALQPYFIKNAENNLNWKQSDLNLPVLDLNLLELLTENGAYTLGVNCWAK